MARSTFHYVNANGVRIPSVTEVLALAGMSEDFEHVPAKRLEIARQRGRDAHEWIDGLVEGHLEGFEPPERIANYVASFRRYCDDAKLEPIYTEQTVHSEAWQYAGTLDLLALSDGEPVLVDLKCTAAKVRSAALQTMAYREATPREWGMRGARRGALYLQADGRMARFDPHPDDRGDRRDWCAAVNVAHWRLRNGVARIVD